MNTTNTDLFIAKITERLSYLKPEEQAGLAALVERLQHHYGDDLLQVVLFGSKARQDFDDESDLDVLVVVRMPDDDYWRHWNEIVNIAWEIELAYNLVISLVIKTESDYAMMCQHQSLLSRTIQKDGVELWMRLPNTLTSKLI
jgi:predicted nucleotidyltransferase